MITFDYIARDSATNKRVKSTIQAESDRAAANLMMSQA
jgi:hypothetical protein